MTGQVLFKAKAEFSEDSQFLSLAHQHFSLLQTGKASAC